MRTTDAARLLAALVLWLLAVVAHAQPAPAAPAPRIGVVTMGPGEIFWERFGHDAIVVADPATGAATSYNFGFFDLAEPGFVGRFIRGEMQYMLVALPLEQDLQYYRDVGRGASVQWLDLDASAARKLAGELAENAKPENARYRYDYYTDNCATRVRDAIDRATAGALRRQMQVRSSGDTWRSESLRLASPAPWMWLGFDIGLGPAGDRPLSRWEQAFLPRRLADDIRGARFADGRPLVASEQVLLAHRLPAEPLEQPIRLWPWLLAGVAIACVLLLASRRMPRAVAGVALLAWALCGLVGTVLALGWLLTDHQALWANRNLLLFSPLCLLLVPGAWRVLRGHPFPRRLAPVLVAVAALAGLALLPLWLQVLPQRNGHWIALLLPMHLAFAWVWARRPLP